MSETIPESDLAELTMLRIAAVRSVQDKADSVEDMFAKADEVVAYYLSGVHGDTSNSATEQEISDQSL